MEKILVVRLSSIGDIILSTPLIRVLRRHYPQTKIHYAIKKEFASLLKHNPNVDRIIEVDSKEINPTRQVITEEHYDWVLNIQKSHRATQLLSGVPRQKICTYSKERLRRFLLIQFKWNFYREIKPVYQRYFEAVEQWHLVDDGLGTEVFVPSDEQDHVQTILESHFGKAKKKLVAICPGATYANKRWTTSGFQLVIQQLISQHHCSIVLLGGPSEIELCHEIELQIHSADILNLAGKLTLLGSAAVLKSCQVALTNDSGLMHLAQAQKTPVVVLFGPTVKEFGFFPLPIRSTVLETHLSCRPCTKMGRDECPLGHHKCMRDISAESVWTAVADYL